MGNKAFSDLITFTRASSGSYYAANGDLRIAATNEPRYDYNLNSPLYQNMALYSEQAQTWGSTNFSVQSNVAIAPDGAMSADKLVESSAVNVYHASSLTGGTIISGTAYTVSFYVKSAGRSQVIFGFDTPYTTTYQYGRFNLDTGVASVYLGSPTVSMTDVGNGWWRCSTTATATATLKFYPGFQTLNSSGQNQYNGDGVSGVYVWGAQVNIGSTALPYYKTTTTPYNQYNLGGVLVEEQRTNGIRNNSMLGAVAGTPGTLPTNWSYSVGAITGLTSSILGTGVLQGVSYIDLRVVGTPSATGSQGVQIIFETATGIAASASQTWSHSAWISIASGSSSNISGFALNTQQYNAGVWVTENNTIFTPTTVLTRYSNTVTFSSSTTTAARPLVGFGVTSGQSIDITLRIGMPQSELGGFVTSPILTSGAAVTRSADIMTATALSPWFNATQGTLYVETLKNSIITPTATYPAPATFSAGGTNRMGPYSTLTGAANQYRLNVTTAGAGVVELGGASTNVDVNVIAKQAYVYADNDYALCVNNSTAIPDTSGTVPIVSQFDIGNTTGNSNFFNGWIRKVKYYPKRLTNAELQALTV